MTFFLLFFFQYYRHEGNFRDIQAGSMGYKYTIVKKSEQCCQMIFIVTSIQNIYIYSYGHLNVNIPIYITQRWFCCQKCPHITHSFRFRNILLVEKGITQCNVFSSDISIFCSTACVPHNPPQQTQNFCITYVHSRPNVFDVGPTLYKCYTNVLCLLVRFHIIMIIHISPKSCRHFWYNYKPSNMRRLNQWRFNALKALDRH